jgi:hypothetical protein
MTEEQDEEGPAPTRGGPGAGANIDTTRTRHVYGVQ